MASYVALNWSEQKIGHHETADERFFAESKQEVSTGEILGSLVRALVLHGHHKHPSI
jgi:hypothetical protein